MPRRKPIGGHKARGPPLRPGFLPFPPIYHLPPPPPPPTVSLTNLTYPGIRPALERTEQAVMVRRFGSLSREGNQQQSKTRARGEQHKMCVSEPALRTLSGSDGRTEELLFPILTLMACPFAVLATIVLYMYVHVHFVVQSLPT